MPNSIGVLQELVAYEWGMRLLRPEPASPSRAAQYMRMSTEHQQYSPENQLEVIRQYAASHGMEIVQAYSARGRSGLNIAGREGLNRLMSDLENQTGQFYALLVYNVSRWGRLPGCR
jgi:DNA invertase Pin-like site-specific DNA recombinase